MPQHRKPVGMLGIYTVLKADLLAVSKRYPDQLERLIKEVLGQREVVTYGTKDGCGAAIKRRPETRAETIDGLLGDLALFAIDAPDPHPLFQHDPSILFGIYMNAPDLTLAVLTKARDVLWPRGKDSKAHRLFEFMVLGKTVPAPAKTYANWESQTLPPPSINRNEPCTIFDLTDCEFALGYQKETGEIVNSGDVRQARLKITSAIKRGQKAKA